MADMKLIIDYSKAPLVQWEPVINGVPSSGKQQEDNLIYPAIAAELNRAAAREITGIIADEARLESYLAQHVKTIQKATHLTLRGAFEKAARKNVEGAEKVTVAVDTDEIGLHSQDAVIMNMILGCVAQPGDYQNIANLVSLAGSRLKEGGELIIIRPNPDGGEFSTYKCLTPANDLKAGQSYDFVVRDLEDLGPMKNLYTPDSFLKEFLEKSDFEMSASEHIVDVEGKKSPFLMNVCIFKGPK